MADTMGLMGMGGAAGVGDAMQTLFDQRMRAATLQQQDDHFKLQQAQQDALTRLKYAELAEAGRQRVTTARQAELDRAAVRDQHDRAWLTSYAQNSAPGTVFDDATGADMDRLKVPKELTKRPPQLMGGVAPDDARPAPNALQPMGPSLTPVGAPDATTIPQPPPENIGGSVPNTAPSFRPVANQMLANLTPASGGMTPPPAAGAPPYDDPAFAPRPNSPAPMRLGLTRIPTKAEAEQTRREKALQDLADNPDTPEPRRSYLQDRAAMPKGESVPYQLYTEPNGPPGSITDANYMLHGKPIVAVRQKGRLSYQGRDVTDEVTPYVPPQQPYFVMSDTGLMGVNKGSLKGKPVVDVNDNQIQPKASAQVTNSAVNRQHAVGAITRLEADIDAADQAGLIGPGAGRLYDLLAKAGTTGDKTKDELIGNIKGDLILAKMHVDAGIGGARAAASPLLMQNWSDLALKSSKELLKGYTGAMRKDMTDGTEGKPGPSAGATKPRFEIITGQ